MDHTAAYKRIYGIPTDNKYDSLYLGNDEPVGIKGFIHDEKKPPSKKPFNPVPAKAKCFKIILNSGDRVAGSTLTAARFNINLPQDFQNKKLNLVVDSFIVASAPSSVSNLPLYPYYVRIAELRSPMTYGNGGEILLTTGTSYQNSSPRDIGGLTVTDPTLFERPVTIEITSPHFDTSAANGISNAWSLQMSLFDDVPE